MVSIISILGIIFFGAFFVNKLNKKDSNDNYVSNDVTKNQDETIISTYESVHESSEQTSIRRYADRDILRIEINLRLIRVIGINSDWFLVQINIG